MPLPRKGLSSWPRPGVLDRRGFVAGMAGAATSSLLVGATPLVGAMAHGRLVATPRQSRGPFYPVEWIGDIDNDLVVVTGEDARALGKVLHIHGVVMDVHGQPLRGARLEIWQTDSNGVYRHPADSDGVRKNDRGFQGFGRTETGADGSYTFRTIRPARYPGRTPHIHFLVAAPQRRPLITQMYFSDEPANARDGLLGAVRDAAQRARLLVKPETYDHVEPGAERASFDVVMQGA